MITDNNTQSNDKKFIPSVGVRHKQSYLKIVKQFKNGMVMTDGINQMLFQKYDLSNIEGLAVIQRRRLLNHQSLIKIHHIECNEVKSSKNQNNHMNLDQVIMPIECGILYEKYVKSLRQCLSQYINFDEEEVVASFQPILEAIDYLLLNEINPGNITFDNIVCTEDHSIKFIDTFLLKRQVQLSNQTQNSAQIYQQLANLVFHLHFPQQGIKSWKEKCQFAKIALKKQSFQFFESIYRKCNKILESGTKKIKKIKKDRKSRRFVKTLQKQKQRQINKIQPQGKQNKIIQ